MSWESTSEWWRTLREVSEELELNRDGELPWKPQYAEIFGNREGLLQALRYRWQLIARGQQADPLHPTVEQIQHEQSLFDTHRGLLLAIRPRQPLSAVA
jgi:hypothetical protein